MRRRLSFFCLLTTLLTASACATSRGVYHTVQPGETIYRIAEAYDVDQKTLARWNGIDDPRRLQVGQQVFVPGAKRPRDVRAIASGDSAFESSRERATGGRWERRESRPDNSQTASIRPETVAPPRTNGITLRWPVRGDLTSRYGFRNGIHHDGLDIGAREGTDVVAAGDGRVIYAGDELSGYGNLIIIRHAGDLSTVYAHNRDILVKKGDFVTAGERIATVGSTGKASGPHLHFEVRRGKKAVDPLPFLP